jgi:hypothetical protein
MEHIMNISDARHGLAGQGTPAVGENVAPVAGFTVERREAPHPYVTGV